MEELKDEIEFQMEEEDEEEEEEMDNFTINYEEITNKTGKQALGCLLGPQHMPTICASFPVTTELTYADYWHHREEERGALRQDWVDEEKFVVVHASYGCEGSKQTHSIFNNNTHNNNNNKKKTTLGKNEEEIIEDQNLEESEEDEDDEYQTIEEV